MASVLSLGAASLAWGDRFAADPVEELRLALQENRFAAGLDARKSELQKRVASLRTVSQLSRALLATEWSEEGLDNALRMADMQGRGDVAKIVEWLRKSGEVSRRDEYRVTALDLEFRGDIADRLEKAARAILERGDATSRLAVTNLIGEMGVKIRTTKNLWLTERVSGFTPLLLLAIKDQEPQVREAAAKALGKLTSDSEAALAALGQAIRTGDLGIRRAAAEALAGIIRQISPAELKYKSAASVTDVQDRVIKAGKQLLPIAGSGIGDRDAEVRRLSVDAILQTALTLSELIGEPTPRGLAPVQRPVTTEKLRPVLDVLAAQTPALAQAASDSNAGVRLLAARTLEAVGEVRQRYLKVEPAPPPLPKSTALPRDTSLAVVLTARETNAPPQGKNAKDPLLDGLRKSIPALITRLKDPDVKVRRSAVDALETLEEDATPAGPALVLALRDSDLFVRWAAARTLGKIDVAAIHDQAVAGLINLLADSDLSVRLAAVATLDGFGAGAKVAVPALARALKVDDSIFRIEVLKALKDVGADAQPAVPAIIGALSDSNTRVRRTAAEVLGRFGPLARSAVPALRKALADEEVDVRRAASEALLSILAEEK